VEEELLRTYILMIARAEEKRGFFHSFNYLEAILRNSVTTIRI